MVFYPDDALYQLDEVYASSLNNATMPNDTIEDIAARYYVYQDISEYFAMDVINLIKWHYLYNDSITYRASINQSLAYQSDIIWC